MRPRLFPLLFFVRVFLRGIWDPRKTSRRSWPAPCRLVFPHSARNSLPASRAGKNGNVGRTADPCRRNSAYSGPGALFPLWVFRNTSTCIYNNRLAGIVIDGVWHIFCCATFTSPVNNAKMLTMSLYNYIFLVR